MKPHKHAELIKAWADGAVIHERRYILNGWTTWRLFEGGWDAEDTEFRIRIEPKPEPKPEPTKIYYYIYNNAVDGKTWFSPTMLPYADSITCQYIGKVEVLK